MRVWKREQATLNVGVHLAPAVGLRLFARTCARGYVVAEGAAAEVVLRRARLELFEEITRLPEYYLTRARAR